MVENWTPPKIMFSSKKYIHAKECMRYYFWTLMPRLFSKGKWKPNISKKECREFLENRGEIIINENKKYIETVTIEQLKNLKI